MLYVKNSGKRFSRIWKSAALTKSLTLCTPTRPCCGTLIFKMKCICDMYTLCNSMYFIYRYVIWNVIQNLWHCWQRPDHATVISYVKWNAYVICIWPCVAVMWFVKWNVYVTYVHVCDMKGILIFICVWYKSICYTKSFTMWTPPDHAAATYITYHVHVLSLSLYLSLHITYMCCSIIHCISRTDTFYMQHCSKVVHEWDMQCNLSYEMYMYVT